MFSKKNHYELNNDKANDVLTNILSELDAVPTHSSFTKMAFQKRTYHWIRENFLPIIVSLIFLLLLTPFIIMPAYKHLEQKFTPKPVTLIEDHLEGDTLFIQLEGDRILFEDAYLLKEDGTRISVSSYDKKTKTLCFPFVTDSESNIYIPVKDSSDFHLLLTPESDQ